MMNDFDRAVSMAHRMADMIHDDVAIITVPEGPLQAVLGTYMLRPLSQANTPALLIEWEAASYVALPGESR